MINFERASHQCSFQCAWTNISVPVSPIGIRFYRHLRASMEPPLWWQPPRMVLSLALPRGGRGSHAATHNNNSKYAWSVVKHAWKLGLLLTCSVIYSVDGLSVVSSLVSYFCAEVELPAPCKKQTVYVNMIELAAFLHMSVCLCITNHCHQTPSSFWHVLTLLMLS